MKRQLTQWIALLLLAGAGGLTAAENASRETAKAEDDKAPVVTSKAAVTVDKSPITRDARLGTSYAGVVKKAAPSVAYIFTTKTFKHNFNLDLSPFFGDEMLRKFFGDRFGTPGRAPKQFKERGLGSGVVVTKDGYLLTNNHVVDGADEIKVMLTKDKQEFTAKVVGRDSRTDIAVLKVEAKDLPFATLGDSDKLEVGDVVLAIGNPFGVGQAVTMGIISATGRGGLGIEEYEDFIQTDAAINPGNSGGALVDIEGRLIGINTAILSRSGGNMGVGFAVPVNLVRNIMDRLLKDGKVVRGFLGIKMGELTPELAKEFKAPDTGGVLVDDVFEKTAAAEAGIKPGDIIVEVNGKPAKEPRALKLMLGEMSPGSKVGIKVMRDGKEKSFTVTLKEMSEDMAGLRPGAGPAEEESDTLDGVVVGDLDAKARGQFKLPAELKGALITNVDPDSASYEAGLREGDVIQEINRKPVTNAEEAVEASKHPSKNNRTLVRVYSNGGSRYIVVDESKKNESKKK
jgi:serine protease Do